MPRREEYQHGSSLVPDRARAVLVSPATVAFLARSATKIIPDRYFVATATHESNFATNEVDTEEKGYVSKGLYQISDDEATSVGMRGANLLDPVMATIVFAKLQERRLTSIIGHLGATGVRYPDVWAFLAVGHNEGMGAWAAKGKGVLVTLFNHGCIWGDPAVPAAEDDPKSYRQRNATRAIVKYGDDCVTGGPAWARAQAG
jgi:hypothetical protein